MMIEMMKSIIASRVPFRSFGSLLLLSCLVPPARSMQATSLVPPELIERLGILKQNPTGREWLLAHPQAQYQAFSGKASSVISGSWCAVGSLRQATAKGQWVIKNFFFIPVSGALPEPGPPSEVIRQCRLGMIVYEFDAADDGAAEEWLKAVQTALDKRLPAAEPGETERNPDFPYPWTGFADWEETRLSFWLLKNNDDKTRMALVAWNPEYWELSYEPTHAIFMDLAKPATTPLERVDQLLPASSRRKEQFEQVASKIRHAAGAAIYGEAPPRSGTRVKRVGVSTKRQ